MPLFTEEELGGKLEGALTSPNSLTEDEYNRASAYADPIATEYMPDGYRDALRKQLALELGWCHVVREHYDEQSPMRLEAMEREQRAMFTLRTRGK